jgi:hypothetical protein
MWQFDLVGLSRRTFLRIWPSIAPISSCAATIAALSTSARLWRSHRQASGCRAIGAQGSGRRRGLLCSAWAGALVEIHQRMGSIRTTSPHPIHHGLSPCRFTAIAGGPQRCWTPYQRFILLLCLFVPRSEIEFVSPSHFIVAASSTLLRTRLSMRLPKL